MLDPNACVGELLARILRDHGYAVTLVSDWARWLAHVQVPEADVVLLDPMWPTWEKGLALCRYLRDSSGVPVLLVTSRCMDEDICQGLAAGAIEVICKPFSPKHLVARLDAIASQQRGSSNPDVTDDFS